MAHYICALIGKAPINEDKVREYGLAVAYEHGFVIVILEDMHIYHWAKQTGLSCKSIDDNIRFDCALTWHWAKELGWSKYAIIQTDYFGGDGDQWACIYDNGIRLAAPKLDIDQALAILGVVKRDEMDEFDSIGLNKYRSSGDYYGDKDNLAEDKPNMIAGKQYD